MYNTMQLQKELRTKWQVTQYYFRLNLNNYSLFQEVLQLGSNLGVTSFDEAPNLDKFHLPYDSAAGWLPNRHQIFYLFRGPNLSN